MFLNYGATLISFSSPDKQGNVEELTMNRTTLDDIVHKSDYFGSTIGRCLLWIESTCRNAFRIANGQFTLNGTHYQLATNSGSNHNHGGRIGFDKCMWDAEITTHADRVSITFSRYSADKEEGYPGALHVRATYSITSSNELDMVFEASGNEIPTIVNMTNHAYWNLSGNCKRPVNNHVRLYYSFNPETLHRFGFLSGWRKHGQLSSTLLNIRFQTRLPSPSKTRSWTSPR